MPKLVFKSRTPGSAHPKHSYLSRTRGPKGWQYEYDPKTDDDEDEGPDSDESEEDVGKEKRVGITSEDASGQEESFKPAPAPSTDQKLKPVNLKLDVGKSILRDAQPEDLENDSIVLWRAIDLPSLDALRQKGKFIGEEPDGGTTMSGTRVGALNLAEEGKTQHEDALVAVNVKADALKPIPPSSSVEEGLFPENPALSAVHVIGHFPANAIVGIVQEGDQLWPSENAEESGEPPQSDQDDQADPEVESQMYKSLKRVYLSRRLR